jgi:hypothetical protein
LVSIEEAVKVVGGDISARDNAALAVAASTIIGSFSNLRDRGLIDDQELMRIAYRFAGEVINVEEMLARGAKAPKPVIPEGGSDPSKNGRPAGVKIDPITGIAEGTGKEAPKL